jgi:aminopeptidase N
MPISRAAARWPTWRCATWCLHAVETADPVWPGRAYQRVKDAGLMTDRLGALQALVDSHRPWPSRARALPRPLPHDPLVIDKWFTLQATTPEPLGGPCGRVLRASSVPAAAPRLLAAQPQPRAQPDRRFCHANPAAFHRTDAAGYVFWAERVLELDALNPQLAARLARAMDRWNAAGRALRSAAREAIARVAARPT